MKKGGLKGTTQIRSDPGHFAIGVLVQHCEDRFGDLLVARFSRRSAFIAPTPRRGSLSSRLGFGVGKMRDGCSSGSPGNH